MVNNGKKTKFWENIWINDYKLCDKFPRLYASCENKEILVGDCWDNGNWNINFRRTFGHLEVKEWESLMLELANVQIGGDEDKVKWKMEKSGLYSTKSMYRLLSFEGVINKWLQKLWNNRTPTKLKVFLWLLFQNRLQSGEALKKKHWKGDSRCILCRVVESVDHIFFECVISSFVWCSCMEALGWDRTSSKPSRFLKQLAAFGV